VSELPADLVLGGFWTVGSRQADGFDGIRGGTQCVRTHMADGYGLTGGSGDGSGCRSLYVTGSAATDESTADLLSSVQLSLSERPGSGNRSARAVISWRFSLIQPQNPLGAVGGPRGDKASVGFA
jgi:hypothetical protein